jgi:broad specificity phosphatase PhoE
MQQLCQEHGLPVPTWAYSSPLKRCGETLSNCVVAGDLPIPSIQLEHSLVESVNEDWFRSWCVPEANGTWGGPNKHRKGTDIDDALVDARAHGPPTSLYNTPSMMNQYETVPCPVNEEYDETKMVDLSGYKWNNFETYEGQMSRLKVLADELAVRHAGESMIVCSHGGPCTHLFEALSGQSWGNAGPCGYTAISLYSYEIDSDGKVTWDLKKVNDVEHVGGVVGGTWH